MPLPHSLGKWLTQFQHDDRDTKEMKQFKDQETFRMKTVSFVKVQIIFK